jgi:hypothetical protein
MSVFAIGTLNKFKTQWKAYLLFCSYFHLQPFQIDAELLCTYSEFLRRSFKSAQRIRNYLNGVKVLFLGHNIEMFSSYVLKLSFRGIDRKLQHLPRQALPIILDILDKFYDHINFNSSIDVTYWYLFIFALFLLSRKSNLVPVSVKKFDSSRQLCR